MDEDLTKPVVIERIIKVEILLCPICRGELETTIDSEGTLDTMKHFCGCGWTYTETVEFEEN